MSNAAVGARKARARCGLLVVAAAVVALAPTSASAASASWSRYVLGAASNTVAPVKIASTEGHVSNAEALLAGGSGVATLTLAAGGPAPVIVLDYGKDVGGIPQLDVESVSGVPTIRASFSESGRYIDPDGDNGGSGPCCVLGDPGVEPLRWNEWTPTAPGVLKTRYLQGGERFERIALTAPGVVRLRDASIRFTAYRATPGKYQGWFLSSDHTLNRIWYAGAYTLQLNMVPPNTQGGDPQPVVIDGARRDRAIWSGDLGVEGQGIWNSLGTNGSNYVKGSLLYLADRADPSGALPGIARVGRRLGAVYSLTYSMHAANAMVDLYRHTGDRAFARRMRPVIEKQLAFDRPMLDANGLLNSSGRGPGWCCGLDWDPYDGLKPGTVTAYNIIYYHTLVEAAYLEANLGRSSEAGTYSRQAKVLRAAINANLFSPRTGLYVLSDQHRDQIAQDANALAVLYGVAPGGRARSILERLRQELWTPHGTRPFSANTGFSAVISPFINGFETAARFSISNDGDALELMRRLWGTMVRPGIDYTGALWENLGGAGTVGVRTGGDPIDNQSLAHGWAAGPTAQLSEYVLGISPVEPGYETWVIAPHLGDLHYARGQVPTAHGPITVSWTQDRAHKRLRGTVEAPAGTGGRIILPGGKRIVLSGGHKPQRISMTGTIPRGR